MGWMAMAAAVGRVSLAARAGWGQGVWVGRLRVGQPLGTFSSLHTIIPVLDQPIHFRESIFVQRVVSGSRPWKEYPTPHLLSLEKQRVSGRRKVQRLSVDAKGIWALLKAGDVGTQLFRLIQGEARIAELAGYTPFGRPEPESARSI
ncbi:hypothetical protein BJY52DRAFT_1227454 [Lactarius psammicola]|nr:hypothetical protein BJY52DRAFT_1227454 [Lactarius psammicola]